MSVSEPGKVSPKVAAIVVRNGNIVGQAFRGEMKPGEHAEYTLLKRKLKGDGLAAVKVMLRRITSRDRASSS